MLSAKLHEPPSISQVRRYVPSAGEPPSVALDDSAALRSGRVGSGLDVVARPLSGFAQAAGVAPDPFSCAVVAGRGGEVAHPNGAPVPTRR